jgi:hypothetical protein
MPIMEIEFINRLVFLPKMHGWIVLLPGYQKGRDYQGFLHVRKRAGSSFGPKKAICVIEGKT